MLLCFFHVAVLTLYIGAFPEKSIPGSTWDSYTRACCGTFLVFDADAVFESWVVAGGFS